MRVTHKSIIAIILVSLVAFLGSFSIVHAQVQLTLLHRWFFSNNVDNVDHCFTTGESAPGSGYVYDDFTCYVATTQIPKTLHRFTSGGTARPVIISILQIPPVNLRRFQSQDLMSMRALHAMFGQVFPQSTPSHIPQKIL